MKKKQRRVILFSKADWAKMREDVTNFIEYFLSTHTSRGKLYQSMSTHISVKTASKRQNPPWMSGSRGRRLKKKHRMYINARASNRPDAMSVFNKFKKDTTREQKRARWKCINSFVTK